MLFLWIMVFSLSGTAGVLLTAATFLSFPERIQKILLPCLISYATGTLLAAAFLGLIPHALEHADESAVLATVLVGILLFFLLEKIVLWRHCHNLECEVHSAAGPMILIGDTIHNFADGVVIAASFLFSIPLGIVTGLSVIAHEIPQETGDFAILLNSGYGKTRALLLNIISSLSTVPAAAVAYIALETAEDLIPYVMSISAASFLYIALADLSPELHTATQLSHALRQFILLLAGIATILLVLYFHPE
ncbi:MAG: ZIP family metal transporter [Theionarchaea archaeon]|nr:ZIP family metal transporter [Theionarchaea archaeon]